MNICELGAAAACQMVSESGTRYGTFEISQTKEPEQEQRDRRNERLRVAGDVFYALPAVSRRSQVSNGIGER